MTHQGAFQDKRKPRFQKGYATTSLRQSSLCNCNKGHHFLQDVASPQGNHRATPQYGEYRYPRASGYIDNNIFYDFLEKVDDKNIALPVVPGVLPIQNFEKMMRFANTCEAHVPDWLQAKLEPVKDSPEDTYKVAEEVLQEQLADLVKNGIEHIHFYALNKADLILGACQACDLGVKSTPKETAEAR